MWIIRDRECGNEIERVNTLEKALAIIVDYEQQDRADGIFVQDFYEIVEV